MIRHAPETAVDGQTVGPIEMGGGDPHRGVCREEPEQGAPAIEIEFAENIIDQENRRWTVKRFEEPLLGAFKREGNGALLPFTGVFGGGSALDLQEQLIAVWTDTGLAEAEIAFCLALEILEQRIAFTARLILELQLLGGTDGCVGFGRRQGETGNHLAASLPEVIAAGGKEFVVIATLSPGTGGRFLEEGVAGGEGAFVLAESLAVGGVELLTEEIEITSPAFSAPAHEIEVAIAEPDNPAAREVFRCGRGFGPVDLESAPRLETAGESGVGEQSVHLEAGAIVPDQFAHGPGAGGLEPQEDADRFEDGGFALGIGADKEIRGRPRIEGDAGEATKVTKHQTAQHFGSGSTG